MAAYLISPPQETSWRMTRQDVGRLVIRLWPDAELFTPAKPMKVRALAWESEDGPHGWFGGSLDEAGLCLYIEVGDYEDIARLASVPTFTLLAGRIPEPRLDEAEQHTIKAGELLEAAASELGVAIAR